MNHANDARGRVVVLDDEANMGKILSKVLGQQGYEVKTFQQPAEALALLRERPADLLLTDLRMPGMTGEEVLRILREENIPTQVIIMTAYGTIESALECVRMGAYDYVTKPFNTKNLIVTIEKALERKQSGERVESLPPTKISPGRGALLVGESEALMQVRAVIEKVAPTDASVLILGESGTGKEIAARTIHALSHRGAERFVAINCASIPEHLIESELFGHERGAFTGAHESKTGLIEAADSGTLFLDEIGELPQPMQAKLLRVLQEREISRIGSLETIPVDIRVLAATNQKLEERVKSGEFREDLYYRINVFTIKMPPLRRRREDIPLLANYFLKEFAGKMGKSGLTFSSQLLDKMKTMEWKGNVRELRNFVQRLVVLADGPVLEERLLDLIPKFETGDYSYLEGPSPAPADTPPPAGQEEIPEYRDAREKFEAEYIRSLLRACGGNVAEAARRAGMSRRNLYDKMEKLAIQPDEYK